MTLLLRWIAFLVGLAGLFVTVKRSHEGQFYGALLLLLFDTLTIAVFIFSHVLVNRALDKLSDKRKGIWWL
jgi:hypothetical protein